MVVTYLEFFISFLPGQELRKLTNRKTDLQISWLFFLPLFCTDTASQSARFFVLEELQKKKKNSPLNCCPVVKSIAEKKFWKVHVLTSSFNT